MAWQEPKTDWIASDAPLAADLNRIEGNTAQLKTDKIDHSLATAVNDFLVASGVGAFVKKTLAEVK
jgi:hypothetical protein